MKILHISTVRQLSPGQRKQLLYEHECSSQLFPHVWDTIVFHRGELVYPFEHKLPLLFSPIFLRSLFAWVFMISKRNQYDYILCRHMVFDLFVWLQRFVNNRVTVHHSIEVEELKNIRTGWKGKVASLVERISSRINSQRVYGILGVTSEIEQFQKKLNPAIARSYIYPNGILTDQIEYLEDKREANHINIIFICGTFSAWHGLHELLNDIQESRQSNITFHIIGKLKSNELNKIAQLKSSHHSGPKVIDYGVLDYDVYVSLFEKSDVGLSSFSLNLKRMDEAATLKVREYLAFGLPVYSGHIDTALPSDYPYYKRGPAVVEDIYAFATEMKDTSRETVKSSAQPLIEKRNKMYDVIDWLQNSKTDMPLDL